MPISRCFGGPSEAGPGIGGARAIASARGFSRSRTTISTCCCGTSANADCRSKYRPTACRLRGAAACTMPSPTPSASPTAPTRGSPNASGVWNLPPFPRSPAKAAAQGAAKPKPGPDLAAELNNLARSKEAQPLFDAVKQHIEENVAPIIEEFFRLGEGRKERWSWAPGQLELLEKAKDKAKKSGLWNFFLPHSEIGRGLTNLDYAYIAAELGKYPLASESLNCSAPDTGNMEVLERVGTPEQKEKWLKPLLNGEIRSAYAMTEPGVASSDAKTISTRAELDGDQWVINGEKYYISGAGDPRCKIMIVMVKTSPNASPQFQQSQILVPIGTPGLEIACPRTVFGHDHAPRGHMHLKFKNCRVPAANILLGEGRGFEISQVRLGPGRIHHCMRSIGSAEKAIELMVKRGATRTAFGKPIIQLGKNLELEIGRAHV